MKHVSHFVSLLILTFLCVDQVYAGTPPLEIIARETAQNMRVNATQRITYAVRNTVAESPVRLNLETNRTRLSPTSPLISWSFSDNCQYRGMAHYVAPRGVCHVTLAISARALGQVSEDVIIDYGPTFQNIAPYPHLNFQVTSSGGGLFFTVAPTGHNMQTNSVQDLIWTLSNTTSSPIALTPGGTGFTVASPLIALPRFTNDCNNTVPANGTCHIQGEINSLSTPGNVSQFLSVTYGNGAKVVVDTPTNFNITAAAGNTRTFSFVNKCTFPVWIGIHGGAQLTGCTTNADCDAKPGVQPGTFYCAFNQCFWKNPVPVNGNYQLPALTGTTTAVLNEQVYSPTPAQPIVWSGVIAGRTNCSSGTCETADCGGGTGACAPGVGFNQPAMQYEMTLQTNTDSFDITSINGINVPLSVEPLNATPDSFNPYTCGSSGITTSQTASGGTIGGCSWTFSPPSQSYVWVADAGSTPCTANSDCNQAGGEACGLKNSSILANSAATMCGKFLGYYTGDQVCGINSSYSQAPYFCNSPADGGTTFTNMFGCNAGVYVNSCYTTGGQTGCCGCQNWQEAPSSLVLPSNNTIVQQCAASGNGSSNATWVTNILPTLIWYKTACPPNYVYPYDDKSSSFTCSNNATANNVNYRVTYCPDGRTGAPNGTIRTS